MRESENERLPNLQFISDYEKITENEARMIFKDLCKLNNNQKTIDLNFIRRLLSLNNNNYPQSFLKIITQYKLIDSIKKGNYNQESFHNVVFNEEEFVNLLTGKETKELLFSKNYDIADKRFKIEEYNKLYEILGGDGDGISKANLKNSIETVLTALNKGNKVPEDLINKEVEEIIELLGTNGNGYLSVDDFVNIMLSNTPLTDDINDIL